MSTKTAEPALELKGISSAYGRTVVLRDVSISVAPGSVTALIGPNGAGKTTALKVASGLLAPTSGSVSLEGTNVTAHPSYARARSGLCHVPEGRGVYRNLTVRENLIMQTPGRDTEMAISRATEVFPILGRRLSQHAGTLSGGEQQMLAMSAAYIRQPKVVLVDEPSLGLAPIIVDEIFQFLSVLKSEGVALLLVDQYITRALAIADRAYVLRRGQIVYEGGGKELLEGNVFEKYIGEGSG